MTNLYIILGSNGKINSRSIKCNEFGKPTKQGEADLIDACSSMVFKSWNVDGYLKVNGTIDGLKMLVKELEDK